MASAANPLPLAQIQPRFTSASGVLALLEEDDSHLKAHALNYLYQIVDQFWAEIADALPLIESLSEDSAFTSRELAAAVVSKCFFHLEEYGDALRLALSAGKYFDINVKSEYTETMISKCIDEYIALRIKQTTKKSDEMVDIDPRMEAVVHRMFDRCYADGAYEQALGIALESRRLDKIEECIGKATNKQSILKHCLSLCQTVVDQRDFRLKVIDVLVKIHRSLATTDYSALCLCLQFLDDAQAVAEILSKLITADEHSALIAYQVAFDLIENENQEFLLNVSRHLPSNVKKEEGEEKTDDTLPDGAPADFWTRVTNLHKILDGGFTVDLVLDFLYRENKTDLLILKNIKTAIETRNSVLHGATVVAHGYMQAGSTIDTFLRDNLDWMGRATNWAKFTATGGLGVIHKGHVKEGMNLLQPYLPQGGVSASPYSEGGALYALGLIHANQGGAGHDANISYLQNALRNAGTVEPVQHGACLGIGLAAMATGNEEIFEDLKNTLYTDSAVAGEAAGLAIGLVLLGYGQSSELSRTAISELLAYAHDTKHEKIIRSAIMGIALIVYGREEEADVLIEQLSRDKDPIVRYGAMYAIGLAFVGTSNNSAIRRLLHVAVSDVNDDVRRAAVTCLGFVLFRTPEQVPKLVSLLAESFNPHVRYGACMAVGISCAGTGKTEAVSLLEPMLDDAVDYVRQGAMISLAMILMQESESRVPKVKTFRERFAKVVTDKHQSTMTKMGAIIAAGILDAGGRNVVISMQSRAGFTKMSSVVGVAIWAQYWFWYPLTHFISLAFQPTMMIGLNKDLKMPSNFVVNCNSKPSLFAYPKPLEEKKEEKKQLVTTAVLSTTARAKARQAHKKGEEGKGSSSRELVTKESSDAMDVDKAEETKEDSAKAATEGEEKKEGEEEKKEKKKEPEPSSFMLKNPSRITQAQEKFCAFDLSARYVPVLKDRRPSGVTILTDTRPQEPEELIQIKAPSATEDEEEAEAPESFEWDPTAANAMSLPPAAPAAASSSSAPSSSASEKK